MRVWALVLVMSLGCASGSGVRVPTSAWWCEEGTTPGEEVWEGDPPLVLPGWSIAPDTPHGTSPVINSNTGLFVSLLLIEHGVVHGEAFALEEEGRLEQNLIQERGVPRGSLYVRDGVGLAAREICENCELTGPPIHRHERP